MKKLFAALATVGLAFAVGCSNESPPSGPGAGKDKDKPKDSANTFTLKAPATDTDLKQGETKEVKVSISRGKDFKEDVTLKYDVPAGVKVDGPGAIKAGEGEAVLKVSADKDAAEGKKTVTVTGKPATGDAVSTKFDVDVKKSGS